MKEIEMQIWFTVGRAWTALATQVKVEGSYGYFKYGYFNGESMVHAGYQFVHVGTGLVLPLPCAKSERSASTLVARLNAQLPALEIRRSGPLALNPGIVIPHKEHRATLMKIIRYKHAWEGK